MEINSKFKNRFRVDSLRHKNWDYADDGYYFITVCTKNKRNFFGNIEEDRMALNGLGKIAENFWKEIPKHFDFMKLDQFVIMPNHVHGILIIENGVERNKSICGNSGTKQCFPSDNHILSNVETLHCNVSAVQCMNKPNTGQKNVDGIFACSVINRSYGEISDTLQCNVSTAGKNVFYSNISPEAGSLSTVIRSYKSICTKTIKRYKADFAWQDNFYDRVIRNEKELENIRKYIYDNPANWRKDEDFQAVET